MRELTVQEMDQASGGILPLPVVSLLLAIASTVVRHKAASMIINATGVGVAAYALGEWNKNRD